MCEVISAFEINKTTCESVAFAVKWSAWRLSAVGRLGRA